MAPRGIGTTGRFEGASPMKTLPPVAAILAVGVSLAMTAGAEGERALSIRAVMHKQYTVKKAPFLLIKAELGSDSPDWEKVREASRTFAALGATLGQREPNWGELDSWKKFTDLHVADASALERAAVSEDRGAALATHGRLAAACKACHAAHRSDGR
jgi:cytochrome c556